MRLCFGSVLDGVDDVVEFGEGVLEADLFHDPPHRRAVCHVVAQASRHAGMQHGERVAVAGEDEGARVAAGREITGGLTVVVDNHLPRLDSKLGAGVTLHARVATQGELGRVAVFPDDIQGIAVLVVRVGVEDAATSKDGLDGELETGRDPSALANALEGPESVLELASRVLISWKEGKCQ